MSKYKLYRRMAFTALIGSSLAFLVLSQIAAPETEVLRWDGLRRLRGDTENLVNESDLRGNVTLGQPFHLALSDHVHRLVTGDCVQRSFDLSEPQARGNSLFDESMVLLHDVV